MADTKDAPAAAVELPETVTVGWLLDLGAYRDCGSLRAFKAVFGGSCAPTRENLFKAGSAGIDADWLAQRLLTVAGYQAYAEAVGPARLAYAKATTPARKASKNSLDPAWKAYAEATARALADVLWPPEPGG